MFDITDYVDVDEVIADCEVKVFAAHRDRNRCVIPDFAQHHLRFKEKLRTLFGGSTVFDGEGGWFNPTAMRHVVEPVSIHLIGTQEDHLASCVIAFIRTMRDFGAKTNQHTMCFSVNNKMYGLRVMSGVIMLV